VNDDDDDDDNNDNNNNNNNNNWAYIPENIQCNPTSIHLYTFMEGLSSADIYIYLRVVY
jgi:hypothetical protein